MDIAKSNIVRSVAGRDTGSLFFVLATEGDFLLLADGKQRRLENPKRKRRKHVVLVDESYQSLTVWMRIFCCNTAVGCPTGVSDTTVGRAVAFLFYQFF